MSITLDLDEEALASLPLSPGERERLMQIELADGFSLVEVEAPLAVVGRTLRELDLRQRFRVNLVAVKRMAAGANGVRVLQEFKAVPKPEDVIEASDVLVVAGSVLDLARFVGDNS